MKQLAILLALSYGINNNYCAGTAGADWELEAAEAELIKAKGEFETASQIAKNDPNKSAVKDAAQTVSIRGTE